MKKQKFTTRLLSTLLLVALLTGCDSDNSQKSTYTPHYFSNDCTVSSSQNKSFLDANAMKDYAESSFWIFCDDKSGSAFRYNIRYFDGYNYISLNFTGPAGSTLEDTVQSVFSSGEKKLKKNFIDLADFIAHCPEISGSTKYKKQKYNVKYNAANGQVQKQITEETLAEFLVGGTLQIDGDTYEKASDLTDLRTALGQAKIAQWNSEYGTLPDEKDVQYNKYGYLGRNFILFGNAELDNYYNWFYSDMESVYFCMSVEPIDGSYSDRWYIYANRYKFEKLFNSLKGKTAGLILICNMYSPETGSNNMATLIDYYIFY